VRVTVGRRVTIRDVAREAGVSVATVSNWLNGRTGGLSPSTAALVAKAVEDLGYRPSTLARGLRGSPTRVLGLIVPSVANPSMPEIVRGAEDRAREAGYSLFLSNIDRHWEKAHEYTLVMLDHGVQGIGYVFSVHEPDHPGPEAARAAGARVAFLLPYAPSTAVPTAVTLDNETAMRQVATHLWNLGHRRVAFAMTSRSTANGPHRLAGLRSSLEERGGSLPEDLVYMHGVPSGHLDEVGEIEAGRRAAMVLLSNGDRPTAIVAVNDMLAVGVLHGARELRLRVPDDVSVVGFDDLAVSRIAQPALTTLSLPRNQLGRDLVDLLIGDPPTSIRKPEIPVLVARGSTGLAPGPAAPVPLALARRRG
jgi:DNA-binding LacI/PurR family transcriptional regulator